MTVDTFFPPTGADDGHIDSQSASSYATARSGAGSFLVDTANDGSGFKPYGQSFDPGPLYYLAQDFFAFDTSSIPDSNVVSAVVFSLYHFVDNTVSVTNVVEVRAYDFGAAITSADWIPGASMSSYTLLATSTSAPGSRFTTSGYRDFTSTGAFAAAINKTGYTRVVLTTDRFTAGTTPTDDETIHPYFVEKGTTFRPKLVVTHDVAPPTTISRVGRGRRAGN